MNEIEEVLQKTEKVILQYPVNFRIFIDGKYIGRGRETRSDFPIPNSSITYTGVMDYNGFEAQIEDKSIVRFKKKVYDFYEKVNNEKPDS